MRTRQNIFCTRSSLLQMREERGSVLPVALVFGSFFLIVFTGLLGYVGAQRHGSVKNSQREEAFNIAEAGIELYRWHIAHELDGKNATQIMNYWNGTPLGIPFYEREYRDPQGQAVGRFRLEVTRPVVGSTVIDVVSTGWNYMSPNVMRKIKVRFRKPAWSEYAVIANSNMRFGAGTEVWGPIHSNGGIRFDGVAHNIVTSSRETYWDSDTSSTRPGVWTSLANPGQVFLAGTSFPVATTDFTALSGDLAVMKQNAINSGVYLPYAGSSREGYHIVLRTNGTMDVYYVGVRGDVSFHISSETFYRNYTIPNDGVIFVEDELTINGTISDKKVTIAAADLTNGSYQRNIYIENDLAYSGYDGTELIGLVAQGSIKVGLYSENDLRIDGALIAQNGNVGRDYYTYFQSPTYYKRNVITLYGAMATNLRYGFSWVCGSTYCSGYNIRNITFDPELIYVIPPYFPTQSSYRMDEWQETQ